ncbi:class I SAM-dependent methyltransferase [Tsuneonella mangrovi]|uniref:class I SAM-dependent methyltransferase n=1 Tax=Tsuneonella mangrovi TaxID=1982042 RepID=UPI000BA1FB73|nr:class I SAM-dependent methyltransferase [Tsuneonella mangrovi]
MTDGADWRGKVGSKWADEWRRTDRSFSGLTDRLLGRANAGNFSSVLDIGCGAGEVSLALARGHPQARVTGIDISSNLLAAARERGAQQDRVKFVECDAAEWKPEGARPDLLVSRHGVMFFPDPVAAFSHLRSIAADGARLVFSCFRTPEDNEWASGLAALLPGSGGAPPQPDAPGPFAFADTTRVESILARSGWSDIAFEPVDYAFVAGSGEDPVADAEEFFFLIGPAARIAASLEGQEREAFRARLQPFLERHRDGNMVLFPAAAWIVSARNG